MVYYIKWFYRDFGVSAFEAPPLKVNHLRVCVIVYLCTRVLEYVIIGDVVMYIVVCAVCCGCVCFTCGNVPIHSHIYV